MVLLYIWVIGDWIKWLYDYVEEMKLIDVYLDGLYGVLCLDVDGDCYKFFMFVSGGIGIIFM